MAISLSLEQGARDFRNLKRCPILIADVPPSALGTQRWVGWQLAFMDWCMTQTIGAHPREVGWTLKVNK